MKRRWFFVGCFMFIWGTGLSQGDSARVLAHSFSLAMKSGHASPLSFQFTTFDGSDKLPLIQDFGGSPLLSRELRPRAGQPGVFESDFVIFINGTTIFEYGSLTLTLPQGDEDQNGIPDFLQQNRDGSTGFSGQAVVEAPQRRNLSLTGTFNRSRGANAGTYSLRTLGSSGLTTFNGDLQLAHWEGTLEYTRTAVENQWALSLTYHRPDGSQARFQGAGVFTVLNPDALIGAGFDLVNEQNQVIKVTSISLQRRGGAFFGPMLISDGESATSWPDYTTHWLEVIDDNDANQNGIPNISDVFVPLPDITGQPEGQVANIGDAVQLTVQAESDSPLVYQWLFNGNPLAGAFGVSFLISQVQAIHVGSYSVDVTNEGGTVRSAEAILKIGIAPSIQDDLEPHTVHQGDEARFEVSVMGDEPFEYSWFRNGDIIQGANGPSLAIPNARAEDEGQYRVTVSNLAGTVNSLEVALVVLTPPSIIRQPVGQMVAPGSTVSIEVVAAGSPPLRYQWLRDGVELPFFEGSILTLRGVTSGDSGAYRVLVGNDVGSTLSDIATLVVGLAPHIFIQPEDQETLAGQDALFTMAATGSGPLAYQWRRDGVPIAGASLPFLALSNVTVADAGSYDVEVMNPAGMAVSRSALLRVRPAPDVLSLEALSGGFMALVLEGMSGGRYVLEATSDLLDWTPLATITVQEGTARYIDTDTRNRSRRFYRSRLLE